MASPVLAGLISTVSRSNHRTHRCYPITVDNVAVVERSACARKTDPRVLCCSHDEEGSRAVEAFAPLGRGRVLARASWAALDPVASGWLTSVCPAGDEADGRTLREEAMPLPVLRPFGA
jgi:hypothetical protein